jgi:hypothetical protein
MYTLRVRIRMTTTKANDVLAILQGVGGGFEIHGHQPLDNLLELEYLGFGDALDVGEFADRRMSDL